MARFVATRERPLSSPPVGHQTNGCHGYLKRTSHLGELIDRGIPVHFAGEGLDLTSRSGRLAVDIQAVVAADYIRNLREEKPSGG